MDSLNEQSNLPAAPEPEAEALKTVRYVTFDVDGRLDGCYLQPLREEHAERMIVIDEALAPAWVNYRANEARDGIEPMPRPAMQDIESLKVAALARTYADVDAVTRAAVGDRAEEYRDAEVAARAFVASGYEGDVDESVSSYAQYNPTGQGQSNTWAAEQIIARADAFRAAQKTMRSRRFASQSEIRLADTPEALEAAVEAWSEFIAGIRAALGV
jgi:hypothetical protein